MRGNQIIKVNIKNRQGGAFRTSGSDPFAPALSGFSFRKENKTKIKTDSKNEHFSEAESVDGLYKWNCISPGYVGLNCQMTGLPDNTMDRVGLHVIYLQYPGDTPKHLINEARKFKREVSKLQVVRREAREKKEHEEFMANVAKTKSSLPRRPGFNCPCLKCGTYCCGDCDAY